MFKGKITFENLILRYPPSVAEYLMEEIARADQLSMTAANQDPIHEMMREDIAEPLRAAIAAL